MPEPFRYIHPGLSLNDVDPLPEQYDYMHLLRQLFGDQQGMSLPPPMEPVFPREHDSLREEERIRRLRPPGLSEMLRA